MQRYREHRKIFMALNTDEAADEMANEVLKIVQEIQGSNKFILTRLNQLVLEHDNHCTCSGILEGSQKDVKELEVRVTELERILNEKDESQRELKRQFESLKERMDSIETSVMAVQTDDSKLRSVSLRKKQAALKQEWYSDEVVKLKSSTDKSNENTRSSAEIEKAIGKTEQPCHVAQVNSVGGPALQNNTPHTAIGSEPTLKGKSSEQKTIISASKPYINTGSVLNERTQRQTTVEVINQQKRETHGNGNRQLWRFLAQQECTDGERTLKDLEGVHSVICLDISASMAEGNAWTEATTFLEDYLKGLENIATKYGLTDEHVALVTFGHVTQVQKRLTNRYSEIRDLVRNQKLGGPSPLYGGMVFGLAAAISSDHTYDIVNNVPVFTKIIIVTDGKPTEVGQYAGPDTPMENLDETKAMILQCCEDYRKRHLVTYCVSVGNANKEYLELLVSVLGGTMLSYKSGNQLARRLYLTTKVVDSDLFGMHLGDAASMFGGDMSELSADDKIGQNKYREIKDQNLAPIGSRVRRGPDWQWNTQDSHGPGTVIGHEDEDQVRVEWDTDGHQNVYRYGKRGYDVLIVEEPRELKPGQKVAVGCVAKQVTKGQHVQTGTVIKLDESNEKAMVRWNDGEKGYYSYGGQGKSEREVCVEFLSFLSEGHVSTLPTEKKTKYKNKNKIFS